jgi:pyruvate dehydrogenase (quinone)
MIKWEQMALGGNPEFGVELQPIDFATVAMGCGAAGFTVERPEDVASTLQRALDHPGPAVVQAVVDPNEPPLPGHVTTEQALNFAKALARGQRDAWDIIKAVAEDKVREVV